MVRIEALAQGESRQTTVTPALTPDAQRLYSTRSRGKKSIDAVHVYVNVSS